VPPTMNAVPNNIGGFNYGWTDGSRPGKPANFQRDLFQSFLDCNYCRNTTLRQFLQDHPNGMAHGILNQLHRRHIISWSSIKDFTLKCAQWNFNRQVWGVLEGVFTHFNAKNIALQASRLNHGPPRATAWKNVAVYMCWRPANVFVGPSGGNVGVELDVADDFPDDQRRDILAGAAFQNAPLWARSIAGFLNG
jgi:hypothetical protein